MATGSINNNPYLQQVLFQNLSSTGIQPGQVKTSAELISSSFNAKAGIATISANGAKINNVSSTVRASGNAQAYEGFQAAVNRAGSSSDPLQLVRFANSADFIARTDSGQLNDSFSSLGRNLGTNNNSLVDTFNSAFTTTVEKSGAQGLAKLNRGIQAIENADYSGASVSKSETMQKYFSLARQVNVSGKSGEEISSNMEKLAKGVELGKSAEKIWNFFNEFTGDDPDNDIG